MKPKPIAVLVALIYGKALVHYGVLMPWFVFDHAKGKPVFLNPYGDDWI